MTPKPPPGYEIIGSLDATVPAPPPGFELIGPAQQQPRESAPVPQPAEMRAYEPTWREQIGGAISDFLGNTVAGDRVASGLVGSSGLGHSRMSVSDVTPARIPMYAQEAKRSFEAGNTGSGILSAVAATPAPIVGKVIDAALTAANPVTNAIRGGATAVQARLPQALSGADADTIANRVLQGRLYRSGQTADTVAADLAAGQRAARLDSNSNAVLPEMLADTSDDMQRLTGSVYRTGAEAGEVVKPALETRQRGPANPYAPRSEEGPQGQIERIIDDFDRALGVKSSNGARATATELEAAQKARAKELYGKAEANSEAFDLAPVTKAWEAKALEYRGEFRDKLNRAIALFQKDKATLGGTEIDNIRRFDNSKKVFDDLIENSKGEFGKATNLTRELTNFKDDLLKQVHGPNGERNKIYQQARDEFGTAAENREAIDLGRKAFREDGEVSVDTYRSLNPAQKKLFRIGLRDALRLKLATKKPGDNATLPLQERRIRELLAEVIPSSKGKAAEFADRPERFGELMRREERMSQTRNAVLGNSATAQRHQDDAQFASDALSRVITSGRSVTNMALEGVGSLLQKAFGYRQDVAAALARKLTSSDPAARAEILQHIRAAQPPETFSAFADGLDTLLPAATSFGAITSQGRQ